MLSLVENLFLQKNPLQDLLSSLNAVISTNESTRIITGHVIYNLAYTYKFQIKTTLLVHKSYECHRNHLDGHAEISLLLL